jgi:hypothetical protein
MMDRLLTLMLDPGPAPPRSIRRRSHWRGSSGSATTLPRHPRRPPSASVRLSMVCGLAAQSKCRTSLDDENARAVAEGPQSVSLPGDAEAAPTRS